MSDIKTYSIEELAEYGSLVCLKSDAEDLQITLSQSEREADTLRDKVIELTDIVEDLEIESIEHECDEGYEEFLNDIFVPLRNDDMQTVKVKLTEAVYNKMGRIV